MKHPAHHRGTFHIECTAFDRLSARAAGQCEVCGTAGRLEIDHDERVARFAVRGLVCHGCNVRLGWVDRGRRPSHAEAHYLANPFWQTMTPNDLTTYGRQQLRCALSGNRMYGAPVTQDLTALAGWSAEKKREAGQ